VGNEIANLDDQIKPPALFPLPALQPTRGVKDVPVHVAQQPDDHRSTNCQARTQSTYMVLSSGARSNSSVGSPSQTKTSLSQRSRN
jgi:hypothetical protein